MVTKKKPAVKPKKKAAAPKKNTKANIRTTGAKNIQRILITSALPYVNNVPHLGNIIGCVLSADVYARFSRSSGKETLYISGTDEHGTTTEAKALEEGVSPREICDKYYKLHKQIYEWFNCSFDEFGRTSSKSNHDITKDIFLKLNKNGYIVENELEQMYCEKDQKFLADRFIEGECPHCNYDKARGDQCDNCGKLLEPTELKHAKCKICGKTPVIKKAKHLFMDLPKIALKLKKWLTSREKNWTENARKMSEAWLRDGLKPRCITRDLKWGVKVPLKGYEDKVFYSWFDAPIGYIGITIDHFRETIKSSKQWKKWWHNDSPVQLVQFIGKDNIPFHTILFPSFLIGTGDPYTLLDYMSSTEYLNYESGKFSKSNKTGVFGDDAMNTGIPSDIFRYYLLSNRPETSDTEFSWKELQEKNNAELLANLGNFVNRTLTFVNREFEGKIPDVSGAKLAKKDKDFLKAIDSETDKYIELLEKIQLKEGIRQAMHISRLGNQHFQEGEPWKSAKDDRARCASTLYACAELARKLAIIVEPYLPDTSKEIFSQLGIKPETISHLDNSLKPKQKIGAPKPIFRKLEDKEIDELKARFSGKQAGRNESRASTEELQKFSILNLKVAQIDSIEEHPEADKLFVLQINLGNERRQLVAGLRAYYKKEELQGKKIVVITNLKPAILRGIKSQGMLLAAEKNGKVKVLEAKNSEPHDQVYIENISPQNAEITIDDFFKLAITTHGKKAVFCGKELKTHKESISVDVDDGGKVR